MFGDVSSSTASNQQPKYDFKQSMEERKGAVPYGKTYQVTDEQVGRICTAVERALEGSGLSFSEDDKNVIAGIFKGELANITMLPVEKDLKSELMKRIEQHAKVHLNLSEEHGHDAEFLKSLSTALNDIVFIAESRAEWSHPSASIRLFIKERGEAVDRTSELLAKEFKLDKKQEGDLYLKLLSALSDPTLVMPGRILTPEEGMAILEAKLLETAVHYIQKAEKQGSVDTENLTSHIKDRIFGKSMKYKVKEASVHKEVTAPRDTPSGKVISSNNASTSGHHVSISEKYEHGEEIPRYIMDFDVTSEHIMNPEGYLDVRLARKAIESMKFVSGLEPREGTGKNIEVFIGPEKDMRNYYESLGYKLVGELAGRTTNRYYYFENPDNPKDAKVIITGASNSSKLFHQLIQLKFAEVYLEKVGVRGLFSIAQKDLLDKLDTNLKSLSVPPEVCFIGNRSLIVETLAERLFPSEMAEVKSVGDERDEAIKKIYEKNGLTLITTEIGSIKYSYVAIPAPGGEKEIGIMGMRMPNGSLAGNVTEKLMKNGVANLFTVGAGGSLDKKADISSYQLLKGAIYQDQEIALDPHLVMDVPFDVFETIPEQKNITVDSPLVENKAWLRDAATKDVNSVDVESYHILKAFLDHRTEGAKILPGIFTSDIVEEAGEHTLEEKIAPDNAWKKMKPFLQESFDHLGIITRDQYELIQ